MILRFVLSIILSMLPPVAAWAKEPSSHHSAVLELITVLNLEEQISQSSRVMIDTQIQANPQLADYRETMLAWIDQYLVWDVFEEDFIRLYMEAFSESEVQQLIAFYKTPIGQKALEKMPLLMEQGSTIGVDVARKHQGELQRMVAERRAELEAKAAE